ncbi:MAG: type IV secretion system DNA-binding domain-containing protein [Bifidobacteriaceae bacterium]|jgi:hypothetical protein|nr:type IV secretion system DNA-binding domain-containing protein [Bifidobacteriaceae bacterium]
MNHELPLKAIRGDLQPGVGRGFRVSGLIPSKDPFKASRWTVENIYNVVSEWPDDAMLVSALMRVKRGVRLYGWVNDAAPSDWLADMRYAFAPTALLQPTTKIPRLPEPLVEVIPARTEPPGDLFEGILGNNRPERDVRHGRNAVPSHRNDPMWEFLSVLKTAMVMMISPASEIEQQMSDSAWRGVFQGGPTVEWEMYRGRPIRTRVTLAETSARTLAESKMLSQRRDHARLDGKDRVLLRDPTVDCLKGFALPKGAACAAWNVPAAALGEPVPGMKVLPPPRKVAPYDAPAKPAEAFRVGRCVDADGRRKSVWMSPKDLCRHVRIVGSSGSGKSTAIRSLLGQWMDAGRGGLVLDPSGALCADLMGDVRDPDRVLYVDCSDPEHFVPMNPLRGRDDAEFESRLQAFMNIIVDRDSEEYTGPRWRRCFGLVARGCRRLFQDRCSLVAVFSILGSRELLKSLVEALETCDTILADQIRQEMANLSGDSAADLWAWLICKGEEVLGSAGLTRILGTGAHAIDLADAMDNSKVVLVNLGLAELGERSAQLLGCMLVAEARFATLTRRDRENPFLLFLDEAQLFQYGSLPVLLDEARKYGLGVLACHQRPDQLRFQVKDALSANAGSYIQLRTGNPGDAAQASTMLNGWPVNDLTRMRDLTGVAVISRDGVPSEPFSIEFDFFKRNREALADVELRKWRAERVRRASYDALVKDYRELPPISRETIATAIKAARADARDRRIAELRHSVKQHGPGELAADTILPSWIA